MYDNFLNTYAFEQMAREYNARYNKATLFSLEKKDEEIKLKVKRDFEKFSHLFYMLKQAFKQSAYKFSQLFMDFEKWKAEVGELFKGETMEDVYKTPTYITHKVCAIELMEVVDSFMRTFRGMVLVESFIDDSSNLNYSLQGRNNDKLMFANKACRLYIKAVEIIKDFYNNI